MKKLVGILVGFFMVCVAAGSAGAFTVTESWVAGPDSDLLGYNNGENVYGQKVDYYDSTINDFDFGFCLWCPYGCSYQTTNSNLVVGSDVTGAQNWDWQGMTAYTYLYSEDWADEDYSINMDIYAETGTESYLLANDVTFNGYNWFGDTEVYRFDYTLTDVQVAAWETNGAGAISIRADEGEGWFDYDSDFGITEVGVELTATPEPTTMLLLGAGLIGLAGISRKRSLK